MTAMTGTGVSTESGIPGYRGPQGLWQRDPGHEQFVTLRRHRLHHHAGGAAGPPGGGSRGGGLRGGMATHQHVPPPAAA